MKYRIFMTTETFDGWLKDSESNTLEEMSTYIKNNKTKLNKVAGPYGDYSVHRWPGAGRPRKEYDLEPDEIRELEGLLAE